MKQEDFSQMTEGEALVRIGFRPAERDGRKGLEIDGVFIPAAGPDERPDFLVASADKSCAVKGSVEAVCSDCGAEVSIAPTSQELLERWPELMVICLQCALKRMEQEKRNTG